MTFFIQIQWFSIYGAPRGLRTVLNLIIELGKLESGKAHTRTANIKTFHTRTTHTKITHTKGQLIP